MKVRTLLVGVALIGIVAFGCKKAEEGAQPESGDTATAATTSEIPGTTSPNDLNPVRAQSYIDDVTIGHEVAADGTIPTGKTGDDFAPGQKVNITMKVNNAPAGTAVKVVFYGPGEKKVGEETKQVATGATYLAFQQATKGWPKGDYRAEVWTGDEKVNTQEFQIVDRGKAGK